MRRMRVSTLPRIGATSKSLRREYNIRVLRGLDVPSRAPGGNEFRFMPSGVTSTSLASSRHKTAANVRSWCMVVGRSLRLCTATSISSRRSAASSSDVNIPVEPKACNGLDGWQSPAVVTGTTSISRPGAMALNCRQTAEVWTRERREPRVPTLMRCLASMNQPTRQPCCHLS